MSYEVFLKKRVKIFVVDNYKYEGIITEIYDEFIVVQDIKVGEIHINTNSIRSIQEVQDG